MLSTPIPVSRSRTIQRQHNQIEALVEALESRFASQQLANRSLVSLLNSLTAHLQMYFELQEDECYFAGVVRKAPHLAPVVERLIREHGRLLAQASQLVEMSRDVFSQRGNTHELARCFQEFREHLKKHELEESGLLQQAFSQTHE